MKHSCSTKIPEIEGLRAIAVLAVVLYHAGLSSLSGGYTGVDVFFVISGYVITRKLLSELEETGSLDVFSFYAGRVKRLFPALLFMVVVVCSLAFVFLSPMEQQLQQNSAIASLAWVHNLYLSFVDRGYFDPGHEYNLFLHTWSLGVEEQFYFFWPFFLLFATGVFLNKSQCKSNVRLFYILLLTTTLGFFFSLFLTLVKPVWGFFLPISRVWQFALGALIVLAGRVPSQKASQRNLMLFIQFLGTIFLCISFFALREELSYPGFFALLPSVGCALVLFSLNADIDTPLNLILRSRGFVVVGGLSYSWYLWHWPVLLLGWLLVDDSPGVTVFLVALSFLMAWLSFRYIELPVRISNLRGESSGRVLLLSMSIFVFVIVLGGVWKERTIDLMASSDQEPVNWESINLPVIYEMGCDQWFHSSEVEYCVFGPDDAEQTAVLLGDSIAAQWFPAIYQLFSRNGWRLIIATKSSCPMIDLPFFYDRINRVFTECEEWKEKIIQTLGGYEPTVIFTGSSSGYPYTKEQWEESGVSLIRSLAGIAEKHVMVITPTPKLGFSGPQCLSRNRWAPGFASRKCSIQLNDSLPPLSQALDFYQKKVEKVTVLNFNELICPDRVCSAKRGEKVVFRDSSHLTASFAESIAPQVKRLIIDAGMVDLF